MQLIESDSYSSVMQMSRYRNLYGKETVAFNVYECEPLCWLTDFTGCGPGLGIRWSKRNLKKLY